MCFFASATAPLFAQQAVVKQVLAVHTSAIEQLKHATDTGMWPLPSMCIACTDRLIHRKCTCRCHVFIPWGWRVFFFLLLIDHFFSHFKIFGRWIFVTNIKKARLLFSVKWRQAATRKNSTLSLCEISVCASKRLFLLVNKKKKVSKSHRIYTVNPVKSLTELLRCTPDDGIQYGTVLV